MNFLFAHFYSFLPVPLIIFSIIIIGRFFLKYIGNFEGSESLIFSYALGYGIVSHIFFIFGIFGFYNKFAAWFFAVGVILILHRVSKKVFLEILGHINNFRHLLKRNIFISTPIILCLCAAFALSFMPPHYYDSLVYHLALPSEYIKNNSIRPLGYNLYSHFPQNAEMTFLFSLLAGDEITANIITFFTSMFLLASLYTFTKKHTVDEKTGILSVFFMVSSTFFMLLSASTYVELHIAFLCFVAVWLFLRYVRTKENDSLLLSAVISGLAIGVKYTGFSNLIAINILLIIFSIKNKEGIINISSKIFSFNLAAFVSSAIWFVKNSIYTGNPVFPFFYNILGYGDAGWNRSSASGYFEMLTEYSHKSSIFFELFLLPYNVIFNPVKFGGGIDVLGDFGWTLLLLSFPLIFFFKKKLSNSLYPIVYCTVVFLIWFFTKPVLRFLVPLAGMLAVISALSIYEFYRRASFISKFLLVSLVSGITLVNMWYFFFIAGIFQPTGVITGFESRGGYLGRILKNSPYPAFEYINKYLSKESRIFFVGEQRTFYCDAKMVATNVFAPNPLISWANDSSTADELHKKIKLQNFDYIFYNISEAERLRPYGIFDFTDKGLGNWRGLLKKLESRIVFYQKGLAIYKL